MKKLRLYPAVIVAGQSFKGVKISVLPSQSMSLQEIIKRFVRKESLPIEKPGVYSENHGDIEKMRYEDITVIEDRGRSLRKDIKRFEADEVERKKALAAKKEVAVPPPVPGAGV